MINNSDHNRTDQNYYHICVVHNRRKLNIEIIGDFIESSDTTTALKYSQINRIFLM